MADDAYGKFIAKVGTRATLSEAEWLFHFDHQNADARDGVPVGATIPDLSLPDQHGARRSLGDLRGEEGLLLVFARSADW